MVKVERSTVINASVERLWQVLRDFNGHDRWHPAVSNSRLQDGKSTNQVGAVRNFVLTGGERISEQLLSLSDHAWSLRYCIVNSDIPLYNYVAEIVLKRITDQDAAYWVWRSSFDTPAGRESELAGLVGSSVYEAGFQAIRKRLESGQAVQSPSSAFATASSPRSFQQSHEESEQLSRDSTRPAKGKIANLAGSAMVIHSHGAPDVMQLEHVEAVAPGRGEVRLKQTAIGLNFIDLHCRSGFYPLLKTPGILGLEAVGTVVDTGPGVAHLSAGQRVVYACMPLGAYASVRTMSSNLVVPLPDFLDDRHAAAGFLKGMTAEFLLHRVHRLQAAETALIFAPAGGVGQLLCQWARHLGATVIGATSTESKSTVARHAGAHHVIVPGKNSLEEQVLELTDGRGANVIYDAVGADTWRHSIAALAVRGHLVSFGQASGSVGSRDIDVLTKKSLTVSRPNFNDFTCTWEMLGEGSSRLFAAIADKTLKIPLQHSWELSAASDAHRAMQRRETVGSSVLIPADVDPQQ